MIQRIQTVYLLIVFLLSILFITGDLIVFGNNTAILLTGLENRVNENIEQHLLLSVFLISVPVLSLVLVFLYKNRKLQMRLTLILIFFILCAIAALVHLSFKHIQDSPTELVIGYKLFLPFLILIFAILAFRGIRKDEDIVRSYDRLR